MLLALCVGDNLHTYDHYSFHGDCILRNHHVLVCQSRSVCCVPAPSDIVEEVGLLQYVRLTCTIHCKVCESWLTCGFVAMIQHKAKLNSLLVAQPHCL